MTIIRDKLEEEIITAFSSDQSINNLKQSVRILKDMLDRDYGNLSRKIEELENQLMEFVLEKIVRAQFILREYRLR